ncbi:MAG: ATP-dependent Clp protease proteolytic subunit [Pseudomonadota bacterium]
MPRRKIQFLMVIFTALAAYLYWQHQENIFGNKGRLVAIQTDDAVILSWHHEIDVPMAKRFAEAFEEWEQKTGHFIIDLHSPGGALREGGNVINEIEKMKPTHLITTSVGPGQTCASMCVPIYLAGENRIAATSSHWMFHEPSASNFFTGEEIDQPEIEREHFNNRFFEKYFTNSDMDPAWREQLRRDWIGNEIWKTGVQLVNERSNIILELY